MREPRELTVGVFGHYGNENLGDEAIIEAVIQDVRRWSPTARIIGFSIKPDDTARRYRIPAYPIRAQTPRAADGASGTASGGQPAVPSHRGAVKDRLKRLPGMGAALGLVRRLAGLPGALRAEFRFLCASYRRLRGVDLLLVSGSNQFLDNFGGPWGFPYTLLKWSVLARLARARLAFASVGAGPIDALLSRMMVRLALLFADYVSFRDANSRRLIECRGLRGLGPVYPDLAHGLVLAESRPPETRGRPTVGINVMPMYDRRYWCEVDDGKYGAFVEQVARFASALLREGYPLFFFATQPKDEQVIDDVIARLDADVAGRQAPAERIRRTRTVYELMAVLELADVVVATRFHGTLLALLAGRPVVGICYYRKTRDLLCEFGQEQYALDFERLEADALYDRFKALEVDRADAVRRIRAVNEAYRAALQEQYGVVLGLAGRRAAAALADRAGTR